MNSLFGMRLYIIANTKYGKYENGKASIKDALQYRIDCETRLQTALQWLNDAGTQHENWDNWEEMQVNDVLKQGYSGKNVAVCVADHNFGSFVQGSSNYTSAEVVQGMQRAFVNVTIPEDLHVPNSDGTIAQIIYERDTENTTGNWNYDHAGKTATIANFMGNISNRRYIQPAYNSVLHLLDISFEASYSIPIARLESIILGLEDAIHKGCKVVIIPQAIQLSRFQSGKHGDYADVPSSSTNDGLTNFLIMAMGKCAENDLLVCLSSSNNTSNASGKAAFNILTVGTYNATTDTHETSGYNEITSTYNTPTGPNTVTRRVPNIVATGGVAIPQYIGSTDYKNEYWSSWSAPQIGAAAALVREARPEWNAMQVREAMLATALDKAAPGTEDDPKLGLGLVQVQDAINYSPPGGVWGQGAYADEAVTAGNGVNIIDYTIANQDVVTVLTHTSNEDYWAKCKVGVKPRQLAQYLRGFSGIEVKYVSVLTQSVLVNGNGTSLTAAYNDAGNTFLAGFEAYKFLTHLPTSTTVVYVSAGDFSDPYYTFSYSATGGSTVESLRKGGTYAFKRMSDATSHPFYVSDTGYAQASTQITLSGDGTYDSGITGTQELIVTIPGNFTGDLYYYCTAHSTMVKTFTIV